MMKVVLTQRDTPPPAAGDVQSGIVAATGGQSGATILTYPINIVTEVPADAAVRIAVVRGRHRQEVFSEGLRDLPVYPPPGDSIDGQAADAAYTVRIHESAAFTFDEETNNWIVTRPVTAATASSGSIVVVDGFGNLPGPRGNGVQTNAAVTVLVGSPNTFTIAGQDFTADREGDFISIAGVGAAGAPLATSIATVISSTSFTTVDPAQTFVTNSSRRVVYGRRDSDEISAIMQAVRAISGTSSAASQAVSVSFRNRCFIIDKPIDWTLFQKVDFDCYGTTFYGITTGQPVIDASRMFQSHVRGLTIVGDDVMRPNIGFCLGRFAAAGANGLNSVINCNFTGYYSLVPAYNCGSETTLWLDVTFENFAPNAWAYIADGKNKFQVARYWVENVMAMPQAMSFSANTYERCRFRAEASGSNCVYGANCRSHVWPKDAYFVTKGVCLWLDNVHGRQGPIYYDGALDGPPTIGVFVERGSSTTIDDFTLIVHQNPCTVAVFATSDVGTAVQLRGAQIQIDDLIVGSSLFDAPARWELYGHVTQTSPTPPGPLAIMPDVFTGSLAIKGVTTKLYNHELVPSLFPSDFVIRVDSGGGTGTATPGGLYIDSLASGSTWDIVNPWAMVSFRDVNEISGGGPGERIRLAAIAEAANGGASRFVVQVAAVANVFSDAMSIGSTGVADFNGAVNVAGTLTTGANAATAALMILNGAAGSNAIFRIQSAGVNRWAFRRSNSPETGSDAGSGLQITAYTDSGVSKYVTRSDRSDGSWQFPTFIETVGQLRAGIAGNMVVATPNASSSQPASIGVTGSGGLSVLTLASEVARFVNKTLGVNYVTFEPGVSGASAKIGVDGPAADIALQLAGKGVSPVNVASPLNLLTGNVYQVAGTQVVGPRSTGWTAMTGVADKTTAIDVSTGTLAQALARIKAIQDAIATHGLVSA